MGPDEDDLPGGATEKALHIELSVFQWHQRLRLNSTPGSLLPTQLLRYTGKLLEKHNQPKAMVSEEKQ